MQTRPDTASRLVVVIDEDPNRVESIALALRAVPEMMVLVHDTAESDAVPTLLAVNAAAGNSVTGAAGRTVVIIKASPAGWTAAAVLASLRPPHHHGAVDAIVITEGPLERLPVLITDFPGLRLLAPHGRTSAEIAGLLLADDARNHTSA
ncbi:MAG TPA: hypothetical protein VHX59_04005 [Mycobacteriales bacterium]|jgi:hypothetical protein|nr:hypothetical protein [Mycobacteriales bacterium]